MKLREICAIVLLGACFSAPASAVVINDNYWGAAPTSGSYANRDVIGASSLFDTELVEISRVGSVVTFDIYTNFAGRSGQLFSSYTQNNMGIAYGDLFLANEWTPFGGGNHEQDNATNGTRWTYGLVLDDRYSNTGGNLYLYELGGTNDQNALMSNDFMTGNAVWRSPQEVAVDAASVTTNQLGGGAVGSWSVGAGYIRFQADLGLTNLFDNSELALHWTMSCANDVVEGSVSVPEPGSLALLGVGLLAVSAVRRRRKHLDL